MNKNVKITTTKSAIKSIMSEILFNSADSNSSLTIPDELPVFPSDQMAMQLSIQRPPVEDPEFVPSSQEELGRAITALSALIPDDKVQEVYTKFVSIIDSIHSEKNSAKSE